MHIESISLRNFRCFGDDPVKIGVNTHVKGVVGDNWAGKSSALDALKRLFSHVALERLFHRSDVHFGSGEDSHSVDVREHVVEVVFAFDDPDQLPHVLKCQFFSLRLLHSTFQQLEFLSESSYWRRMC